MSTDGRLLLFVEDCAATRLLYQHTFTEAGFRVAAAADGRAGVDQARALRPDLIIMDLDLPVLDGLEAARQLRKEAFTRTTPIIVLTGSPSRYCVVRAHELGCDAYLTKPCAPKKLLETIEQVLRERGAVTPPTTERLRCANT